VLWTDGVILLGYTLAGSLNNVPNVDKYILPATFLIVLISISPILIEIVRNRRAKRSGTPTDEADVGRHHR
jgi:membrane-associated protein